MDNIFGDIWSIFWLLVWSAAYIGYLFAFVLVIIDIFRDHTLNGWYKAIWLIVLLFVPFLTVLIYLIARGKGMAERNQRRRGVVPDPEGEYVTGHRSANPAADIEQAKKLLDAGTITAGEFDAIKAHALGSKY